MDGSRSREVSSSISNAEKAALAAATGALLAAGCTPDVPDAHVDLTQEAAKYTTLGAEMMGESELPPNLVTAVEDAMLSTYEGMTPEEEAYVRSLLFVSRITTSYGNETLPELFVTFPENGTLVTAWAEQRGDNWEFHFLDPDPTNDPVQSNTNRFGFTVTDPNTGDTLFLPIMEVSYEINESGQRVATQGRYHSPSLSLMGPNAPVTQEAITLGVEMDPEDLVVMMTGQEVAGIISPTTMGPTDVPEQEPAPDNDHDGIPDAEDTDDNDGATDEEEVAVITAELLQKMQEARARGEKTFTMVDPTGVEITVDVLPQEVIAQGTWNWQLRTIVQGEAVNTPEELVGRQVWRMEYGPTMGDGVNYEDKSGWRTVIDVMDLGENGVYTLESSDPAALARGNGTVKTPIINPRFNPNAQANWMNGTGYLWDTNRTWNYTEVRDYKELQQTRTQHPELNYEVETLREIIVRATGGTINLVTEFDESYVVPQVFNGQVVWAWKEHSEAGRPVYSIYLGNMIAENRNWTIKMLDNAFVFLMQWTSRQAGRTETEEMLLQDQHPGWTPSGLEGGVNDAFVAFLGTYNYDDRTTSLFLVDE